MTWSDILALAANPLPSVLDKVTKSLEEWRAALSPEVFQVTRQKSTERPFSSAMCHAHAPGFYACACCGSSLFASQAKFDSGTGWPSFTEPLRLDGVTYHVDHSYGIQRVEVCCSRCDAHLGHVFPDGPKPSRLRFCINALALVKASGEDHGNQQEKRPKQEMG